MNTACRDLYSVLCLRMPEIGEEVIPKVRESLPEVAWILPSSGAVTIGFKTLTGAVEGAACALQKSAGSKPAIGIAIGEGVEGQVERMEAVLVARMLAFEGSPGQVLLTRSAYDLLLSQLGAGMSVKSLGLVLLEGGLNPQEVFQLNLPGRETEFDPLEGTGEIRSNFIVPPTGFVGREQEQRDIQQFLKRHRTVTITGPGGIGKTALAKFTAHSATDEYLGGGWWIDFSSVDEGADIAGVICSDLRVGAGDGLSSLEALQNHLAQAPTLLVLDNCEDLARPVARVVEKLLAVDGTSVIVTSRAPLFFKGERVLPLGALETPEDAVTLESLEQNDAIRLLFQDLEVPDDLGALNLAIAICRHLDGMPLGLELACARLTQLAQQHDVAIALEMLLRELREPLPEELLEGGTGEEIDAVISWSFAQLAKRERTVLLRLSSLEGSWSKSLGIAVACSRGLKPEAASKSIRLLAEHGLLQEEGRSRYRILVPVKAFLQSVASFYGEDLEVLRRQYAEGVANWVEDQWANIGGMPNRVYDIMGRESDHLPVALDYLRTTDIQRASCLLHRAYQYWLMRGPFDFGAQVCGRMVESLRAAGSEDLCVALYYQANLSLYAGKNGTAIDLATEAEELASELQNRWIQCEALCVLAHVQYSLNNLHAAEELLRKVLALSAGQNDIFRARYLSRLAALLYVQNRIDGAEQIVAEAEKLNEVAKDDRTASSLVSLRHGFALARGNTQEALDYMRRCTLLHRRGGNLESVSNSMFDIALLAARLSHYELAARILGAAEHMDERLGIARTHEYYEKKSALLVDLAETIGLEAFEREARLGASWSMEEAISYLNSF